MSTSTTGDFNSIPCPWCGAEIRDLWDGPETRQPGDPVECGTCERESVIQDVYTTIVLDRQDGPPKITAAVLLKMSDDEPQKLLDLIQSGDLSPSQLTFAAEYAGETRIPEQARPILMKFLDHPSPLVREGAIMGLSTLPKAPEECQRMILIVRLVQLTHPDYEPSPGVRAVAREALELLEQEKRYAEDTD